MRTKIDANGTLVDFFGHDESFFGMYVREWGGVGVVRRRWRVDFFTLRTRLTIFDAKDKILAAG
jgi:hypothetical protein